MISQVFKRCAAPVYINAFSMIGRGPVGGSVNYGIHHGRLAADMTIRILNGTDVKAIPIMRKSPTDYMFDYKQLKRFGIPLAKLPAKRIIANEPRSFYYSYKKEIWFLAAFIASLAAAVVFLVINTLRRMQVEKALRQSEQKFRSVVDNVGIGIALISRNMEILFLNQQMKEWFPTVNVGQNPVCYKAYNDPPRQTPCDYCPTVKSFQDGNVHEAVTETPAGRKIINYRVVSSPIKDSDGKIIAVIEMVEDVTKRKQNEEKLREYQVQLKSLASELTLAEERERRHIATELHDRIGQSLVISKVKLEQLLENETSDKTAGVLDEVCNMLGETIEHSRSLTFDLSSPILREFGFGAAVAEWLTENVRKKHNIITEFEDDGEPKPLDDDTSGILFRMVRELLINVVKHAKAHKVKVCVRKFSDNIHIIVEDDGVGFNTARIGAAVIKNGGFGLFSIRERLQQLGGFLEIKSERGHGCKVTIIAPFKQKAGNVE